MDCLYEKCDVTNIHERSITCWLCEGHAHLKCAGLNGRHFDKIVDRSNGLRWSCLKCRQLDIDFYKFFIETKRGFSEFNKEFCSLLERFRKFENMFKNFKFDSITSPKHKRPAPRNMVISDEAPLLGLPPTPDLNGLFTPIVDELPIQTEVLNLSLNGPLSTMVVNEDCPSNGAVTPLSQGPPTRIGNVSTSIPSISVAPPSHDVGPVHGDLVPNSASANSLSDSDLVVVSPRKIVFLSRLANDTSVDRVCNYIRSMYVDFRSCDCNIIKLNNRQQRDISSFKIIVPLKMFDVLVDSSFWPPGLLVTEFIPRSRPTRPIPVNLVMASKN
ncbi:uncharacterized protein LOC142224954 [Haematobia irritans]|uniref:uncharacterized protein LOC142224954 n=1 Tax=Haematobia irritans TaxID=7368 RepID=UPI003F503FD9